MTVDRTTDRWDDREVLCTIVVTIGATHVYLGHDAPLVAFGGVVGEIIVGLILLRLRDWAYKRLESSPSSPPQERP